MAARISNNAATISYPNGDQYVGQVEGSTPHGYGVYDFAGDPRTRLGHRFVGNFNKGMFATGTMYYANGNVFSGEFESNLPHGQGDSFERSSGDTYSGEFFKGHKHGRGSYVSRREGWRYEGEFANGMRSGRGVMYDRDGDPVQQGVYNNNKFIGRR